MILTTTPTIEGRPIREYKGIVTGETIIGANFLKDFMAGIRDIVGGRSNSYEKVLREAKDTSMKEMEERAAALGANAILTSDGEWYDVTNISEPIIHTWDKEQDINNTYRYFIGYVDDNPRTHINITYYEPLDYIIGDMRFPAPVLGSGYTSFICNFGPQTTGQNVYRETLVRFVVLPEANNGNLFSINSSGLTGGANAGLFCYNNVDNDPQDSYRRSKLTYFEINNVKYLCSFNLFSRPGHLKEFIAPDLVRVSYSYSMYPSGTGTSALISKVILPKLEGKANTYSDL